MLNKSVLMILVMLFGLSAAAQTVMLEAESFDDHGGWKLDTQFIFNMGSPYLMAHGLGKPVKDATTTVTFPETGEYHVHVRTLNWVAKFDDAKGAPGKFQLVIDGKPLKTTFGTEGAKWTWQSGGTVNITNKEVKVSLHDLTGFNGRCDAIVFTKDGAYEPPNTTEVLPVWRRELLGLPAKPIEADGYDLVVVGGGYSGLGSAISASRMGIKVALIQNRPVLGGNGSSEVRVWAMGNIRRGKYPRVGEIIEEISDNAKKSPGTFEEFEDDKKLKVVLAENNIELFLNHHAYKVETEGKQITAVTALDTRTNAIRRFSGKLFVDCTGHGTIGYLAKADWEMTPKGRMGMSNMWRWDKADKSATFPETPWALDLKMKDFPYPRDGHGQWFWESGFDKHPIKEAEAIRDWNLRAVFGAFNAMKNRDGKEKHADAVLTWVAYIGGPRESRRLMGDVVLTQDDIVSKRDFPDGFVPSTWSIDLHYPKKQYAEKFPDNPFISYAVHDRRVDRQYGYPVPYRCFYSRNVENLFMAGRCVSVTHEALGTVRVMKTCGMMGEVVGKAASICVKHNCLPRDVYASYLPELTELVKLPGKARRKSVNDKIVMPEKLLPTSPYGPPSGLNPADFKGLLVDDTQAKKSGNWTSGTGLKNYVNQSYLYASADSKATCRFELKAKTAGHYDLRLFYQHHENRGTKVPVAVAIGEQVTRHSINMKQTPPVKGIAISLGKVELKAGQSCIVTVSTERAGGFVHADAVQLLPVE